MHAFVGDTDRSWAVVIYRLLVLLTGGLLWVICHYSPRLRLWTLQGCPLHEADVVHVKVCCVYCMHSAAHVASESQHMLSRRSDVACESSTCCACQQAPSPCSKHGTRWHAQHVFDLCAVWAAEHKQQVANSRLMMTPLLWSVLHTSVHLCNYSRKDEDHAVRRHNKSLCLYRQPRIATLEQQPAESCSIGGQPQHGKNVLQCPRSSIETVNSWKVCSL